MNEAGIVWRLKSRLLFARRRWHFGLRVRRAQVHHPAVTADTAHRSELLCAFGQSLGRKRSDPRIEPVGTKIERACINCSSLVDTERFQVAEAGAEFAELLSAPVLGHIRFAGRREAEQIFAKLDRILHARQL